MVVELRVPRWSSDQWGSRGGWGLLVVGGVTIALGLAGLGGVLWAFAGEQAVELTGGLLAALASVALLAWAVPAVVLGRLLLRAPEVDAGDVAPDSAQTPLATSYLPLWFLLAFVAVVACGVLTK